MKTDLYTKTILTVIAVFLGVLIFQNTSVISTVQANTTATAQTPPPTAIKNETVDVNISHIGGVPITKYADIIEYPNLYRKEINIYSDGIPVTIERNKDK